MSELNIILDENTLLALRKIIQDKIDNINEFLQSEAVFSLSDINPHKLGAIMEAYEEIIRDINNLLKA